MSDVDKILDESGTEATEWAIELAKTSLEPYKAEWAERRDTAKTLISLSSAALIFTITFAASIITPSTARFWRYIVLLCWLAFIGSLVCSLASLWFSIGLSSLPVMIAEKEIQIKEAMKAATIDFIQAGDSGDPDVAAMSAIILEQFRKIARDDQKVYWLLRASVVFFGTALLALTAIGVRQLLR